MEIYKEIILLKQGLSIIYDPDQYAAMMNCGKRLPEMISPDEKEVNQLEMAEHMEEDEDYRKEQFEQVFLKKFENGNNKKLTEIDKKLYSCLKNPDPMNKNINNNSNN